MLRKPHPLVGRCVTIIGQWRNESRLGGKMTAVVDHCVVVGCISNYVRKKPGLRFFPLVTFPPSLDSVPHCPLTAIRNFSPVGVVFNTVELVYS